LVVCGEALQMPPFLAGEASKKVKALIIIIPFIVICGVANRTACICLATDAVISRFRERDRI
jgi:hypothetical protein